VEDSEGLLLSEADGDCDGLRERLGDLEDERDALVDLDGVAEMLSAGESELLSESDVSGESLG